MKTFGARARNHGDVCTRIAGVLGLVIAQHHLYFLDRVHVHLSAQPGRQSHIVGNDAVHHQVLLRVARALDRAGPPSETEGAAKCLLIGRHLNARQQPEGTGQVTAPDWKHAELVAAQQS